MTEKETIKHYTNGEVTIVWQPKMCMHSTICWKNATGLPEVFDPKKRPWIEPLGASTEKIIEQVDKCPSGALSYYNNAEGPKEPTNDAEVIVEIDSKGPLMVYGKINIINQTEPSLNATNQLLFAAAVLQPINPFVTGRIAG